MCEQIKKQIEYKIKHANADRLSKVKKCQIKLKTINAVEFYKKILFDKFNCNYQDLFYSVIQRTIQWYYKWYFDVNCLQYNLYETDFRLQLCNLQIDLQNLYMIFVKQKKIYKLDLDIEKEIMVNYLVQCYKNTKGNQNFV